MARFPCGKSTSLWQVGVLSILALAGCRARDHGTQGLKSMGEEETGTEMSQGRHDKDYVRPPDDYYRHLIENRFEAPADTAALLEDSNLAKLYLNFEGAALVRGYARGQSFLLCRASVNFPAAGLAVADKEAVRGMVQKYFDDAAVALVVTTERPAASENYTTIHVGGTYGNLGCPEDSNVLGIAPLDEKNRNANDVGFVFAARHNSDAALAASIAHEAAHTFGLQHVTRAADLMYAYAATISQSFLVSPLKESLGIQDGPAYLQSYVGRLAMATGTSTGTSTTTGTATDVSTSDPGMTADCQDGFVCFFTRVLSAFQDMQGYGDSSTSAPPFTNTGTPLSVFLDAWRNFFGEEGFFSRVVTFLNSFYGNNSSQSKLAVKGVSMPEALTVLGELYAAHKHGAIAPENLTATQKQRLLALYYMQEGVSMKDMEEQMAAQRALIVKKTSGDMRAFLLGLQKSAYEARQKKAP